MRLPRPLSYSLLLSPLLLAACSQAPAPAADDAVAPPPMSGPAPPAGDADRTEAPAPAEPTAPFVPQDAASTPAVESGPNAPADAAAQGAGENRARIERVLGDAGQYEQVFKSLQQAVASGDRAAVAALVRYPLKVGTQGASREVSDAATFQREYDRIITAPVARAIAAQSFDTVFVNQQGVMIGSGQVWINGTCVDQACTHSDVKVGTIQE